MQTNTIHFPQLPYYLTVKQVIDGDIVTVFCESKIHVNNVVKIPTSFSTEFVRDRHSEFLRDILSHIVKRYGLKLEPAKYS